MSQHSIHQVQKHFIHPGEHYVTADPIILSTLLGSCVSVCLFDPVARIIGMNHFLLPMRNPAGGALTLASDAGRYGLWAMELLINGLLNIGAQREHLRAKAFGGGNVLNITARSLPERFQIGTANALFVRKFLADDGIPLIAEDLGGDRGRQIHFDGSDFSVYLRRIPQRQEDQIAAHERAYLHRTLKDQRRPAPAEFF
ncbi:chemotaxis protein CheD [Chromatium weissei]|nr:chemotaxis protein CheD [Chromatium weissei]